MYVYDKIDVVRLGWDYYAARNFGDRGLFEEIKHLSRFENIIDKNSNILDACCGTGKPIINYFINKGHEITGVDISPRQLQKARLYNPNAKFIEGNILEVLHQRQIYDGVVLLQSIEYIQREKHDLLLKLIYNSLSDKGKLLLTHPVGQKDEVLPFFENSYMYYSHFSPDMFEMFIGNNNFKCIYKEDENKNCYYILSKK